jgi:hypothetical protein
LCPIVVLLPPGNNPIAVKKIIIPYSNESFITVNKTKAKLGVHAAAILLFHILNQITLRKLRILLEDITTGFHIRCR